MNVMEFATGTDPGLNLCITSLADPGFYRGAPTPGGGGANLLFSIIFAENCMKMKKGAGGDGILLIDPILNFIRK